MKISDIWNQFCVYQNLLIWKIIMFLKIICRHGCSVKISNSAMSTACEHWEPWSKTGGPNWWTSQDIHWDVWHRHGNINAETHHYFKGDHSCCSSPWGYIQIFTGDLFGGQIEPQFDLLQFNSFSSNKCFCFTKDETNISVSFIRYLKHLLKNYIRE